MTCSEMTRECSLPALHSNESECRGREREIFVSRKNGITFFFFFFFSFFRLLQELLLLRLVGSFVCIQLQEEENEWCDNHNSLRKNIYIYIDLSIFLRVCA